MVVVGPADRGRHQLHGDGGAVDQDGHRVTGPGGRLVELRLRASRARRGEQPAAGELGCQRGLGGDGGVGLTLKRAGCVRGVMSRFSGRSYLGSKTVLWVPSLSSWAATGVRAARAARAVRKSGRGAARVFIARGDERERELVGAGERESGRAGERDGRGREDAIKAQLAHRPFPIYQTVDIQHIHV